MSDRYANTHLAWVFRKLDQAAARRKASKAVVAQPSVEHAEELRSFAVSKEW